MASDPTHESKLLLKLSTFLPVCFSITDYQKCVERRVNSTDSDHTIYHRGRCITDKEELETIVKNFSYFYKCERVKEDWKKISSDCYQMVPIGNGKEEKEVGVYVNENVCDRADRADEFKKIEQLFDIPSGIRKTGTNYLTHFCETLTILA